MHKTVSLKFKGSVVSDLKSRNKLKAMSELISRAPVFKGLKGNDKFVDAVFKRESEKNTGFGHGVAVAHGRDESINHFSIALGISEEGIDYSAYDGKPVKFLFMIATPERNKDEYLRILASLMTVMRNKEFREELLALHSSKKIEKKLTEAFDFCCLKRGTQNTATPQEKKNVCVSFLKNFNTIKKTCR